jgi:predicted N-acetyltransferase YhbS
MTALAGAHARVPGGQGHAMITLRHERLSDIDARETLLDEAFGETRTRKSSERLREGRLPADGLAFIAADGRRVIGTARLWNIAYGSGRQALLLGPVAVAANCRSQGIGAALVRRGVAQARKLGHGAVILVGDAPYYNRFGFTAEKTANLRLPGPFERHRLLALELVPGALDGAQGMVVATGRLAPQPDVAVLAAQSRTAASKARHRTPRAA